MPGDRPTSLAASEESTRPAGRAALQEVRHLPYQDVGLHRFGQEIVGPGVEGLHRRLHRSETADHEDGDALPHRLSTSTIWMPSRPGIRRSRRMRSNPPPFRASTAS